MFTQFLNNVNLGELLANRKNYHPYPTATERNGWESLSQELKQNLIHQGERYLNFEWPSLPASRFMDFRRDGNRSRYETLHFARRQALSVLIISECVEAKGRFIDDIINGIWCICEESFWGLPAHNYNTKYGEDPLPDIYEPIIDLFAAETAGLVTFAVYLLQDQLDKVSPLICERIRKETKFRILDPFLERKDFWWMGYDPNRKVNNWNPWINSNCLTAFLILEENEDRRTKAITKAMETLDKFIGIYHPDGGCDEGTSYWGRAGASLFDCLEQMYTASEGKISFYDESIVKEIGRFIYKSYIDRDYFINFADGAARVSLSSDLVYRYGRRIKDSKLMAIGSNAFHANGLERPEITSLLRVLPEIFNYNEIKDAKLTPPYVKDSWMDGIQVMASRKQEGSSKGFYLAAKGGNNAESHNHNDIGQFIVYYNGKPVIIDIGVEVYTKKTFSPKRYEIWTMQSAYHNLPTVNNVQQAAGEEYKASEVIYSSTNELVKFSQDISTAYPKSAGIKSWKRGYKFIRGEMDYIEIIDDFKLKEPSNNVMLSLMTPYEPVIDSKGTIELNNGDGKVILEFNGEALAASSEFIKIEDTRLLPVWGGHLYRVVLKAKALVQSAVWVIKVCNN